MGKEVREHKDQLESPLQKQGLAGELPEPDCGVCVLDAGAV